MPDAPVLGELLVQRGLLSDNQLARSLDVQQHTGRRLGDIVVELGFVPATAVAQALATQHGGLLKSEYGVAVGFDTGDIGMGTSISEPPMTAELGAADDQRMATVNRAELRLVEENDKLPMPGDRTEHASAQQVEPSASSPTSHQVHPALAAEPVVGVPGSKVGNAAHGESASERREDHAEPEAAVEQLRLLAAELASAVSTRDQAIADAVDLRKQLQAAVLALAGVRTTIGELEAARDATEATSAEFAARHAAELASIRQERDILATRIRDLDIAHNAAAAMAEATAEDRNLALARAEAFAARIDELKQENARLVDDALSMSGSATAPSPDSKQVAHPAEARAYLAFVTTSSGYRLLECTGPPPTAGDTVTLSDDRDIEGPQLVVRVGASPLPGTSTPCAYLIPAR